MRDMAAAKAMLAEAGVDFGKPIVMLHVANAPGIAALGNVTRQVLVDLGFKVDMQAMDFQTFATRRLNTKPVSEGGWNLAHTTNTVPDQGNPLSNPFLVASGPPASAWGWPTDPTTEALRLKFASAPDATARRRSPPRFRYAATSRSCTCLWRSSPLRRRGATICRAC